MIPIRPLVRLLRFKVGAYMIGWCRLLVIACLVLAFWPNQKAEAHPLDAACLAQTTMTQEECQKRHDAELALDQQNAMSQLEAAQTKFPTKVPPQNPTVMETISRFLGLGFVHIVPRGLDHILFVLALFLGARTWKQLLAQVSAFTVAHSVTLGLAALSVISVSAKIVEPLIAMSIAFLAFENIIIKKLQPWRLAVVFGFGLFHGLGFAGVLGELGLDKAHFLASLIAFNVGVEGGQLCVIALAAVPALMLQRVLAANQVPQLYETILVRPASILIGLMGLWWAIERVFFAG